MENRQIKVVPYNPEWPEMFNQEALLIKQALGDNCMEVHHIGSTAVPGLMAKPIIDMIGVIKDREKAIRSLEPLGYSYKGEYNIPLRLYFNKRKGGDVNLHLYEAGHPEIELNLLFINYLRLHPEAISQYAALKTALLAEKSSFEKNDSLFTGYTLGKNSFIQDILQKAGFNRLRFMQCAHTQEWAAARSFRQKYFFDKVPVKDPYTYTFDSQDHVHFVLYQGAHIIGYAHLQLWPSQRVALRIIVIDEPFRNQTFGGQFLDLCERWLRHQGYKTLHLESSPEAYAFYKKHGYQEMPFNNPEASESDPRDIPLGKVL